MKTTKQKRDERLKRAIEKQKSLQKDKAKEEKKASQKRAHRNFLAKVNEKKKASLVFTPGPVIKQTPFSKNKFPTKDEPVSDSTKG